LTVEFGVVIAFVAGAWFGCAAGVLVVCLCNAAAGE